MRTNPLLAGSITAIIFALCATAHPVDAQGITTAALRGSVHDPWGTDTDGPLVRVINTSTGFASETHVRHGSFLVNGLAIGGPYRIVVTRIGYSPQVVDDLFLSLGEDRRIDFNLVPLASGLDTIRISGKIDRLSLASAGGVATSISDSLLRRLPTLNRDLYDFVRLVPQVSTRFGMSGAGANFRFNSYMIDGVSDRQLQGNNVMGAGTTGGKSISVEAIKEYQVLLSSYEARYGDFSGMLVNAVTKSGTNAFQGSAYSYARNERLARQNSFVGNSPYRREQFGFTLGGPIIRNRLHFFLAPEFQYSSAPTPGPHLGSGSSSSSSLPVSEAEVSQFMSLLSAKGIASGDGGRVISFNPSTTLFGRLDLSLPERKSRIVLLGNRSSVRATRFARPEGSRNFALTSNAFTLETAKQSIGAQIFTQASPSIANEFLVAYLDRPVTGAGYTPSPAISVTGAKGTLIAGPPPAAGGAASTQVLAEMSDHVTIRMGSRHAFEVGGRTELFTYHAAGVRGMFGQWTFSSLDAFSRGEPSTYTLSRDFGTARARVRGLQPSAYISDDWLVSNQLSLTIGMRADALDFFDSPQYNPVVDSVFARRTSDYPATRVQWSPRFGFSWKPFAETTRIRGGAGIFVSPPPLGWLLGPVRSDGAGVRTLGCNVTPGFGKAPKFVADVSRQPLQCADGRAFSDGPVALVDKNLRMAESFRASLSIDQRLPWKVDANLEALYSRAKSDFVFVNADLAGAQSIDVHGRVLYGTIDQFGRANVASRSNHRFPEAIDLRNTSLGHSWSATAQMSKPFSDRSEFRASYTHSRVRDVQSLTNGSAAAPFDTWASGRALAGHHDEMGTGISSFEVAHRVVAAGTYAAPWKRWKTDVSLYYIGESGSPFTYGDSTSGRGDLNADGTSANDPIYVPRDATNPAEIVFSGTDSLAQGAAFEDFIRSTPCLSSQRGAIVARNSCRGSWLSTSNLAVRQSLSSLPGRNLSLQLDVFNVLNLLNHSWGLLRTPNPWILQQLGQTKGSDSQPVYHFDSGNISSTQNLESGYQLQVSLRVSF